RAAYAASALADRPLHDDLIRTFRQLRTQDFMTLGDALQHRWQQLATEAREKLKTARDGDALVWRELAERPVLRQTELQLLLGDDIFLRGSQRLAESLLLISTHAPGAEERLKWVIAPEVEFVLGLLSRSLRKYLPHASAALLSGDVRALLEQTVQKTLGFLR